MPLSRRKPSRSALRADERIVFFPTAAHRVADRWQVPIHGWIYRPGELSRLRRAAFRLAKRLIAVRFPEADLSAPAFKKRFGAFLGDNERGSRVEIEFQDAGIRVLCRKSRPNGHFEGVAEIPLDRAAQCLNRPKPAATPNAMMETASPVEPAAAQWLSFTAVAETAREHNSQSGDSRVFEGRALLLPPRGISVISDIDDTIKVTEVLSRRRLLGNTFLRDFAAVPAMAGIYRYWAATRNAAFHYVSASPWHLYPFLAEFLAKQQFPAGTFHLRDFRLMPRNLRTMFTSPPRVKTAHIRRLLAIYPARRFLLVGDSGESDADMYAALARQFPRQIERIFIRNITHEPPGHPRWQKTFRALPPNLFRLFESPAELEST